MPLSKIQIDVLRVLAAGSTPLNRAAARYSGDIDIFHDREERVATAARQDGALLEERGYELEWLRRDPAIYTIVVRKGGGTTKLEWVADSDFRFFPTIPDETFGYILHPVDLATNKVAAAYGRREPRDVVDLVTVHERILPLGAAVRAFRYTAADFRRVASDPPVDPAATMMRLREILGEAEAFVIRMPTEKVGLLFLEHGNAVQPDPNRLEDYRTHAAQPRGQWPSSSEITSAMIERYSRPPEP